MQQRNLYSFLAFDFGHAMNRISLNSLAPHKNWDYDVEEAVDVVVFEDNLESK
jgi:tRNA pseudouridine55 synthase